MLENFEWFVEHYEELQEKYGDAYLGIKDKSVVGVYSEYAKAVDSMLGLYEPETFIVQKCSRDTIAYNACIASMDFM